MPNFIKTRSVEAELFHEDRRTDGQTDMTKLLVAVVLFRLVAYFNSYRN